MNTMEQYFMWSGLLRCWKPVVLTVKVTDKTLLRNPSKAIDHYHVQAGLTLNLCVWETIQMRVKQQYIRVVLLKCCTSDPNVLSLWMKLFPYEHSNESYHAILFCAYICVFHYSAKYHLQKVSYLVWFDRCDLPSCWTALSALHGNSIVTWTRRHWLAARRSACNEIPLTGRSTKTKISGYIIWLCGKNKINLIRLM